MSEEKRLQDAYLAEMFPRKGEDVPRRRFAGFSEPWQTKRLGEVFKYEQPQEYIVDSTQYSNDYTVPVLTAGQSFILGYTDEEYGIKEASAEYPIIIFDDFTTSSHLIDFPFKVKSSAIKLLTLKDNANNIYCAYNVLRNIKYVPKNHERHWISKFSNFEVSLPSLAEQQKIGAFFRSLDELISCQRRKLDKLTHLKQAYLAEMFV